MSEWKEYKLQDVVSKLGDGLHGTPQYDVNGDYFFINGNNLVDGKIVIKENTQRVSHTEYLKYKKELSDRTILLGINGTIGNIAIYNNEKCVLGKSACYFNVKNEVDKHFIKYVVTNKHFQDYIETFAHGTTIMNVSLQTVREYTFKLPPLPEQIQISSILSSLDDKIDLLHRQNKTLEQIAETLFRQWFVEEAEDSWEIGRLEDILESIESGSRPKGGIDPELKDGIPSIGAENINGLGVYNFSKTKFITQDFFKSMKRGIINTYDVLIYKDGAYVGRKGMFGDGFPYKICTVNEHVFILRTNSRANQFYLYFLLQQDELAQLNSNSAQPGLNQEAMKSFEIIMPPIELIIQFEEKVKCLIDEIFSNCNQINTLTQLRDTLLPKLMSGEVMVKN